MSSEPGSTAPTITDSRLAKLAFGASLLLAVIAPLGRFGMNPARLGLSSSARKAAGERRMKAAVEIAGESGRADFAPAIVPLLSHEDRKVRREAVRALGSLGHPDSVGPLLALTADEDLGERAAEALAGIATPESEEALRTAARSGEKDVRREAEKGLERLGLILPQWVVRDAEGGAFGSREEIFPPDDWIDRIAAKGGAP